MFAKNPSSDVMSQFDERLTLKGRSSCVFLALLFWGCNYFVARVPVYVCLYCFKHIHFCYNQEKLQEVFSPIVGWQYMAQIIHIKLRYLTGKLDKLHICKYGLVWLLWQYVQEWQTYILYLQNGASYVGMTHLFAWDVVCFYFFCVVINVDAV